MNYELAIADRTYSSWSLRGWLLFEKFAIPCKSHTAVMYLPEFDEMLANFAPARLVPAMKFDGCVVTESLAIAETLHEQNPDKNMWPQDPQARALARSLAAEMHAGFGAIRSECTMNLRRHYPGFQPTKAVLSDVERAVELWTLARDKFGQNGPWLFSDYCIADVFYAPLASRIATYNLPCSNAAKAYVNAHLSDPVFRRWRAMGLAQNYIQPGYDKDLEQGEWPGPKPLKAQTKDQGPAENDLCPYSDKPVNYFLEVNGRVFGTCNLFCRDKTIADAAAWPAFMAIYNP